MGLPAAFVTPEQIYDRYGGGLPGGDAIRQAVSPAVDVQYNVTGDFDSVPDTAVGVVVVGETPYAEGVGDRPDLHLSEDDRALIARMRAASFRGSSGASLRRSVE